MTRFAIGAAVLTMAAAVLATGGASAQPIEGPYVSLGVGANYAQPFTRDLTVPASGLRFDRTKFDTNVGLVGLGSVGYGLGGGWRLEAEGNYRENEVTEFRFSNSTSAPGNGKVRTYGAMANLLFDFDVGSSFVYPYVGAGAGYAWSDTGNGSDRNGRFAAQAIFGSAFPIVGMPGLSFTFEYRFFALPGSDKQTVSYNQATNTVSSGGGGAGQPGEFRYGQRFDHSVLVGLRYAFDVPAPPAPEPPAAETPVPAPARSYLIFFDWDRATLTARARTILREAADNVTHASVTRIEVNGYTDTSGTPRYNQGLSVRRADAVAAELVRDGVPKSEIAIQGFGETRLLVPTASGVREPQNRRVEIILR